jgi:hypothetical protein
VPQTYSDRLKFYHKYRGLDWFKDGERPENKHTNFSIGGNVNKRIKIFHSSIGQWKEQMVDFMLKLRQKCRRN